MPWTLTSAVLTCGLRRARTAAVAEPLPTAIALAVLLASPLFALASGRELSPIVSAAGTDPTLARALCAALALPALLVGATVGALAPDVRTIGAQLAAAPVARVTHFTFVTLMPLAPVAAVVAVPAFVAAFAAAADARPGRWLAVTFVAALGAAAAAGAAGVAIVGVARDAPAFAALAGALGGLWLASGAAFGEPVLGVVAPVSHALGGGTGSSLAGAGVALLGALAATSLWAAAAALAPADAPGAGRVRLPMRIPGGPSRAFAVATVARLSRHAQVRRHLVLAALVAGGGAITARLGMPGEAAVYVAFAAALVAAAGIPPAAFALAADARWLTRAAPASIARCRRAVAVAAAGGSAAVVVGVLLVAAPLAQPAVATLPALELTAAVVVAAAVAGGALAPWRPERVLEQTVTYVVVGALAAALAWGVGRAAAEAAAAGLPEGAAAALTANVAVLGAIVFAGRVAR